MVLQVKLHLYMKNLYYLRAKNKYLTLISISGEKIARYMYTVKILIDKTLCGG